MPMPLPDLEPLLADRLVAARPELEVMLGPSDVPLALLPVRLETRFHAVTAEKTELRIRIYPDTIHIDAHDRRLSAEEADWAERYWTEDWRAGDDETRRRAAWRMLAERFEPQRAAWIARVTTPLNADRRPSGPRDQGAPLPITPQLPAPGERARRAATPLARLLPDHWTATAYRDGEVIGVERGKGIDAELAVGPDLDPALAMPSSDDESAALDLGMSWIVDFERAVEIGMAMRMILVGTLDTTGVDVLIVSGVRQTLTPEAGAERIADLLDAHHYTDGLGFLAPGTPTNNTAEERSGYASRERRGEESFVHERAASPLDHEDSGNAALLARALGLDDERAERTLGPLAGAADDEQSVAADMHRALWPVTWGYFLGQMAGIGPGQLSLDDLDWCRAHAIEHVRPLGALPTIRCGRQPYGWLPVTSLGRWRAREADSETDDALRVQRLRELLVDLQRVAWRPALERTARVGRSDDLAEDLAAVLRGDASSSAIDVRRLMGTRYVMHLWRFLGKDFANSGFWTAFRELAERLPKSLGIATRTSLYQRLFEESSETVRVPFVQGAPEDAPITALEPNYIRTLLDTSDIDALATPSDDETPLLHALLRHALLREHAQAATRLLGADDRRVGSLLRDRELIGFSPVTPSRTWHWQREQNVPGATPERSVRDHLNGRLDRRDAAVRSLLEFREALERLASVDPRTLERHLLATLDTASHRLDAWASSLAGMRLAELREHHPTGLVIGGYGWVEGLRPEPARTVETPPEGELGPLREPDDDPGFVHAPSLDQATTAALLRNAHLAYGGGADDPYAIVLDSARIRTARQLFDGVREGQPLGALLGYAFERRLHEAHLDELIDNCRRLAPRPGEDGALTAERRLVLDGRVLHEKWTRDPDQVLSAISPRGGLNASRRTALRAALDALGDAIDAASDAVSAEGVHQLVRGNLTRGAGSLDDIANGNASPPELESMRTPRGGTGVTHRVALLLAGGTNAPTGSDGWPDPSLSPRARAEPLLNAWAERLLGPARGVIARVGAADPAGGTVPVADVELVDLGLAALDVVALSGDDLAELHARVIEAATAGTDRTDDATSVATGDGDWRVDLSRRPDAPPAERSLADLLTLADAARRLIAGVRPMDGADLQAPHVTPDRGIDLADYERRAHAAEEALAAVDSALSALIDGETPPSRAASRTALVAAAGFGVPGAFVTGGELGPDDPSGADEPGALGARLATVRAETARRIGAAATLRGGEDEPDDARRDRILGRFKAVFGDGFVALPRFRCPEAASLAASLADAPSLRGTDALAADTWLLRMERVRPALARLGHTLRSAEVLGTGASMQPEIVQVPHRPGQRWVALDTLEDEPLRDGCASVVLTGDSGPDFDGVLAGLLIDEWVEIVPSASETTGIAFRYDPPDATAPQAILLAVPPVPAQPWSVGTLNQVLLETLDLARQRAVDPAHLDETAHYLPAIYLAFNIEGEAVSTDPAPLAS